MSEEVEATMELDVTDAAEVLDAPARTVKFWFKTGRIPAKMPFGNRYGYRITAERLREYLNDKVDDGGVRVARLDAVVASKRAATTAPSGRSMIEARK